MDPRLSKAIRRVCLSEAPWPLFIHGPSGTGKTCAALSLADHTNGVTIYTTADAWVDLLNDATFDRAFEDYPGGTLKLDPPLLRKRIERAALVVLDELATRDRVSDVHYRAIKDILDLRHGLPLVVLSNLGPERLESIYDDRITDRAVAGTVVALDGPSQRSSMARNTPNSRQDRTRATQTAKAPTKPAEGSNGQ